MERYSPPLYMVSHIFVIGIPSRIELATCTYILVLLQCFVFYRFGIILFGVI